MRAHIGYRPGLVVLAVLLGAAGAGADDERVVTAIREFFETGSLDQRAGLVRQIESDPDYSRRKVAEWLHQAVPFAALTSGRQHIQIRFGEGRTRSD